MLKDYLFVFDLDFTLWNCGGTWCDHSNPPYHCPKWPCLILFLLVAIVNFGQNTDIVSKTITNNHLKYSELNGGKINHQWINKNNRSCQEEILLKSAQATRQRLDSVLNYEFDKYSDELLNYRKDIYDASGDIIQNIYYGWDEYISQCFIYWREDYTYDLNGNIIQYLNYDWLRDAGKWLECTKGECSYDTNGNMLQYINSDWYADSSKWVKSRKGEYSYDINGKLKQYLRYNWDKNTTRWINNMDVKYTFDISGNMTLAIYSFRNTDTSQWYESFKDEYFYNTDTNMVS